MKKIIWTVGVVAFALLGWYLFLRDHEFEINFKVRTLPGDVTQTLRIWNRSIGGEITDVDSLKSVTQQLAVGERDYIFKWHFNLVNDSITNVSVKVSEPSRRIFNKVLIPFSVQPIENDSHDIALRFFKVIKQHLSITRVKIEGESKTRASFCVCRELKTRQTEKANGMMREYGMLTSFITNFNLQPDGPPTVNVVRWQHANDSLEFEFCFPIIKQRFLPESKEVIYKEFAQQKALKAVYNGNYITSDRAWYELLSYAHNRGYNIKGNPIELFYSNPNLGSNEHLWKAEIFIPIH